MTGTPIDIVLLIALLANIALSVYALAKSSKAEVEDKELIESLKRAAQRVGVHTSYTGGWYFLDETGRPVIKTNSRAVMRKILNKLETAEWER